MEHSDLVAEMTQVERLSTQDRLYLARMRRAQQLKINKQKDKEWQKAQSRKERNAANQQQQSDMAKVRNNIQFPNNVILLEAAARNDIVEVAKMLERGVSPDSTNEDGLTALHQCCIDNNADMLSLLLDYGANVNAQDSEKWSPLHAAATCGHLNLVKFLISRGANLLAVNADGNMPYDLCDDEETLDCIEAEMSRRGVTQELIDETRSSTELRMLEDLRLVAGALAAEETAELEGQDHQGATPLHIAAANGYVRVVDFLLDHHVNVDATDVDLWTPCHAAACWGHLEVLEQLAVSGADLVAKNKNGETPSDICEDPEIRERIEQLRTEQESKRLQDAHKKRIRRSQSSNTRTQSVRRTSLREKILTTKKDAVEEARLRLRAQEVYSDPPLVNNNNTSSSGMISPMGDKLGAEPIYTSSSTPDIVDSATASINQNNGNNGHHGMMMRPPTDGYNNGHRHHHYNSNHNNNHHSQLEEDSLDLNNGDLMVASLGRQSPEGKDNNLVVLPREGMLNNNKSTPTTTAVDQYSADSNNNGKINVQVTVLFGTLADLKKHRAQSRFTQGGGGGAITNGNGGGSGANGGSLTPSEVIAATANGGGSIVTATTTTNGFEDMDGSQKIPIELSLISADEHHHHYQSQQGEMMLHSNNNLAGSGAASLSNGSTKFSGIITGDVVSDSTRSKRCCIVM